MKRLFTTTAMVLALGFVPAAFAQTTTTDTTATGTTGFLAMRSMNQMLATDLIGHDVYARRMPLDMTTDTMATETMPVATMTADALDAMDNVGQINDLILSNDGAVAAVVIGIGGFLGAGEQDVAVMMNEVSFAANPDDPADMYIVLNTSGDMLKASPKFDRTGMMTSADPAAMTTDAASDRALLTAPAMTRDGYNAVKVTDVSIDLLIGKTVYGVDDSNVGTVSDVTVGTDGAVQNVIIDFGGFLGMGSTQVALGFDELTILTDANNADIRVYVDATKDQIKAMPVYTSVN